MKESDYKTWKARFSKAKSNRSNWEGTLRECYELFLPNRDAFNSGKVAGSERATKVVDDAGTQAVKQFVNQLKNKLMPAQQKWAKIVPSGAIERATLRGEITEEQSKQIQIELDRNSELLFNYIKASNLDVAIIEALQDMCISTGAILISETGDLDNPFNCASVPSDQLVIEECNTGTIKNVWREWYVKAEEIPAIWPQYEKNDVKLNKLLDKNPTTKIKVIEGTVYDYKERIYKHSVLVEQSDCKFIFSSEYKVSPWIVFRWSKTSGETWGRGPALDATPTMRTLNQLSLDQLKNNAMAINPPVMVNAGAFVSPNAVKVKPNARMVTKSDWSGNSEPVRYLTNNSNIQLGVEFKRELHQNIKDAFYLDSLGSITDPTKSATEINIRNQQMLEQQTTAVTRLTNELITPLIKRIYYTLERVSAVSPIILNGESTVDIKPIAALAQVQDNKDLESVLQYLQTVMGIAGEQGLALAASEVDMSLLPAYVADKLNVPASLRMDEKKKREQAAQVAQVMQQQGMQGMPPEEPPV